MIVEQDTTILEYQLIGPTTFESSMIRKTLRLSPTNMKNKLKNNNSSSPNIQDNCPKLNDFISERGEQEPNSFDCLRIKDMRAREALIMDFLLKVSDIYVIVIDKYTAIEKKIISKLRSRIENSRVIRELIVIHEYFNTEKYSDVLLMAKIE